MKKDDEIELEYNKSKELEVNLNTYSKYLFKCNLLNQPWSI